MLYLSIFDAKENTTRTDINRERSEWLKKGRDRIFQQKCKAINRYEVLGISPLKIILIVETEDPDALHLLSTHFGDAWNSVTYPIVQREIAEALEADTAVIGG
ncbi:MAG: hypothetical protein COZ31_02350 [Nitrospirae bacterium CG_4_10_14_3_um_filter_44_29]|nr:hypothetical protein [Nitrospirota bacterium]OIO31368.1 MAG: hypothetical protein AUJ60_01600 [Nitrospirae bacterium CG1_02_44_142]PIV43276.1 MAG: hypothetical protein COS28_02370 [Nitrospirae bacterium CG02_land_8_20_14_3_00_44_33]PIV66785.1 MAG: hypothetical protein COS10_04505 [Nitrospirae bacterium CG01_land_8_20_14_3_00_44_22]PIW89172.1 MAG: hypothetical protein COZ93_06390 [Nitrospirae bacterium CG_4_8_14_3_um_filter_44_28]PIX89396.1 MAG: hypothetical protein COZ31_02350 [Nitrospirae 